MRKFAYKFSVMTFVLLGVTSYSQEKKQFSSVSSILQYITPNIKADSWILVHQSYGKDDIIKKSGTIKDYTLQSSGFNIGIPRENQFDYIVYSSGGKLEYVTDLVGLQKFIGKVDNIQEAAIFASTEGYIVDEEFKDLAGSYYDDKLSYYLDLGKLTSKECPYQKKHFTLTVSKSSGNITDIKDNGAYIELYNKKCTNNPRLLKIEKKEEPKDEPKKSTRRR